MKTMKVALLATAALAAVSVSARADDTAALKAQLESLTARIATLEAAPAAPIGYSLLTISEGKAMTVPGLENFDKYATGDKATIIGVMPTADVPASTTIEWSGYVRASLMYVDMPGATGTGGDDEFDIRSRGQIKVVGKTDTAVGEVGALMVLRAEYNIVTGGNPGVVSPEYWGWWAMTPELTLGAGYTGSLSNNSYTVDSAAQTYFTDNADAFAFNDSGDTAQMRLSYASGPLSFAIAVEDASTSTASDDAVGVAAELKYTGDTISLEIAGGVWDNDDYVSTPPDANGAEWMLNAGAQMALGDMLTWDVAVGAAEMWNNTSYIGANTLLTAALTDSVSADIGVAYKDWKNAPNQTAVLAGIWYSPVSQLTIGVEGEWSEVAGDDTTWTGLTTVFRF